MKGLAFFTPCTSRSVATARRHASEMATRSSTLSAAITRSGTAAWLVETLTLGTPRARATTGATTVNVS